MKLKNALCIISFLSICTLDAKRIAQPGYNPGITPPSSPTPYVPAPSAPAAPKPAQPKPVTNQFQSLLYTIRNSNQANVISDNGKIVAKIREDIQNSNLAEEQKQALLQATVTVKMPFTAANNQDTVGRISSSMAQASSMVKEGAQRQPVATEPFYNPETNLFNQLYLESQVKFARADDLTLDEAEKSLIHELMPMIINAWKKRNIAVSRSQVDAAREQIFTAVTQDYKSSPKKINRIEEWDKEYWYDREETHLIKPNILTEEVETILKDPKNRNVSIPVLTNNLSEQYLDALTNLWKQDRLNVNEYSRKLYNQIKEAFTRAKSQQNIRKDTPGVPAVQEKSITEELFAAPKPKKTTAQLLVEKNDWYDAQTYLFDQKVLDFYTKHEAQQQHNQRATVTQLAEIYIKPYFNAISTLWNDNKLNIDEYAKKLLKQVEDSFTKAKKTLVQQVAGKKPQTKAITPDENLAAVAAVDGLQKAIYAEIIVNNRDAENKNTRTAVNNLFKNQPTLAQSNDYERVAEMIGNALQSLGIELNILTIGTLEDIIKEIMMK